MAVNWLQNRLITNNKLLDPVLFFRSVGKTRSILRNSTGSSPSHIMKAFNRAVQYTHCVTYEANPRFALKHWMGIMFTDTKPGLRRAESKDFVPVTQQEFLSVSELVRGRSKLEDVNKVTFPIIVVLV